MKLRVSVDGKSYEVEVEPMEVTPPGAALRVESLPVTTSHLKPPPGNAGKPGLPRGEGGRARNGGTGSRSASPPSAPSTAPVAVRPPWHGLSEGQSGESTSPVAGTIVQVLVKVGDAVRANDPLVVIELSRVYSMAERPLVGTVRALQSGVVADVLVKPGDAVAFGQVLARLG